MARQSDIAKEGRNVRRNLQRRINKLENRLNTNTPRTQIAEERIKKSIVKLREAQEATKFRATVDGAMRTRTEEEIKAGIARAKELSTRYTVYLDTERKSFLTTQSELNKASVEQPSVYTKEEVQIFYKMTQEAWQREGVDLHERNEAILAYYGRTSLAEFVDEVLETNKERLAWQANNPALDMTEEDRERNEREQQHDQEDIEKGYSENLAGAIAFNSVMELLGKPERL